MHLLTAAIPAAALGLLALPAAARAHAGAEASRSWLPAEPWVLASLALLVGLYVAGFLRARRRSGTRIASPRAGTAFAGAIVVLFLALMTPADRLSAQLFSAHMVQHLILMLVAAPLLVWGRTGTMMLWSLPPRGRQSSPIRWSGRGASVLAPLFAHPLAIWAWFSGVFVFWHVPGPYRWALQNEALHALEHAMFLASAYGFWWIVISPLGRRRLGYGWSILFVATAAVVSGLPGALMILAARPLYGGHAEGAAAWGLTLVQDQQLGGLIMWIPAGFAYLAAVSVLLVLWLRESEHRANARVRGMGSVAPALLAVMLLAGCEEQGVAARFDDIGDPDQGAELIDAAGCGSCHLIPGIDGARGMVGPPLIRMGERIFIAGLLRNTPANMTRWLRDPQAIVPGVAMPDTGLSEEQARHVAAYLYTLR